MTDIRQTSNYANYLNKIGWQTKKIGNIYYFIRKIPVFGFVVKIQRPQKIDFKVLDKLTKKYRAFQIIVEPTLFGGDNDVTFVHNQLISHRFKLSKSPYLPTKTTVLDLVKSESQLLKEMKKDARHAIKNHKEDLIEQNCNIIAFLKAWKKTAGLKRYVTPLKNLLALKQIFGDDCVFIVSKNNKKQITAGAIFLKTKRRAYYWQAFTNTQGRIDKTQYNIVWEGIRWSKDNKCKLFDFEGIYDARFPNKSWLGFSHFKKSFGGSEVEYPGCYIKNRFYF